MLHERMPTDEENELLDEILEEDEEDGSENCSAECAEDPGDQKKPCACTRMAEHSSRFSLRVMEAMRSLQTDENDFLPTSSVEDIVDYIQENYRDDGDLYAQVRTALKQVCSQGFVMELLENEYHLIGPHAASMNQITCSRGPTDCKFSSPAKAPKRRKNSGDMCICIAPSKTGQVMSKRRRALTDGTAKRLKKSRYSNLRAVRANHEEDELTETETLTDEEVDTDVYQRGTQKIQHALQSRDDREDGAMETGDASKNIVTDILEEIYEDEPEANTKNHQMPPNRLTKDKQREKELKRWIERCQKECERQKNRRTNN